jgi:undecaprenyl-diphosphatase
MNTPSSPAAPAAAPGRWLIPALSLATVLVLALGLSVSQGEAQIWWQVVALGVIEGVTEFLPISSTAHLLIAGDLLGFEHSMGGTFEIFIQLGAVLAVVVYYARDLLSQLRAIPRDRNVQQLWLGVLVAMLPALTLGLLLRTWIKQVLFESPALIASTLIIGGAALIIVERLLKRAPATHALEQVRPRQALAVGFAQVLALVPGVSRSASSIVGGMLSGMDRRTATAFSFYLSIPTLGGATLVDLLQSLDLLAPGDLGYLLVGTLVAFVVAWLSIGWLLRYVASHTFTAFGVYRIAAGLALLALIAAGRL